MSHVLIIDDDKAIRRSFTSVLERMGLKAITSKTGRIALSTIKEKDVSLVFLDLRLPDMDGMEVLREVKKIDESILVIIITGYATVESAVEAMRLGAYDYIKKPFKSDSIKVITKLALEKLRLSKEIESLNLEKESRLFSPEMIGACEAMVAVARQVEKVAPSDASILIQGETGTGKELVVSMLHKRSQRSSRPLIHVNCSAFPENLLESEFFGYEKGAFTGALSRKRGLIEQADGGTLHLDEVGDMPLVVQAKLLRVLEEKRFRRVGGSGEIAADIRIIASTNKGLLEEVNSGSFRLDLYYRLCTIPIFVPPLRERGEDVILLAEYWIKRNNLKLDKAVQNISDDAKELLLSYHWPGNVRELRNVVERAILLLSDEVTTLFPEHLPLDQTSKSRPISALDPLNSLLDGVPRFDLEEGINYDRVTLEITGQLKGKIIERALQLTGGNKTKAAKLLHLSRSALWREMEKLKRLA